MSKKTPISSIMTRKIVVANLNHKFTQVRKLFLEFSISHLPVVEPDSNKILGIISATDMLHAYAEKARELQQLDDKSLDETITLADIMTTNIKALSPDDPISKAAEIFSEKSFHSILIAEDGELLGIVTTKDIIRFLSH